MTSKPANSNRITHCEICGKKITSSIYDGACSKICAQERLEYNFIRIPKQFTKNLVARYKQEEWEVELTAFADRHRYRTDLVIKKFHTIITEESYK